MRRSFYSFFVCCFLTMFVFCVSGCETMGADTKKGAIGGGLIGAVAGGVIGHQMGSGIAGAAIGGTVGALAGGTIGSQIDDKKKAEAQDQAAHQSATLVAAQEKMGISDVIVLAKSGLADDTIIDRIVQSGAVYNLSVEEIEQLRKEGVSTRVINYMMGTRRI